MAKLGQLVVELATNTAKFTQGINNTNKKLDQFAKNARRVANIAGGAFALIGVGNIGRDIVDVVDKYKLMEGRLKLVKREGESLAETQQKLFDLANRTRQGVGETVDFYTQLARSTRRLGLDQQTLLDTTEAINKAIIISGASAQSANAALFQLQQGLASGTLRGQELNSVLEQTPRVAEAIAEGLGVTIGQLRKMGEQGQLTAEAVIGAITKQADTLDKEFSEVPKTVAQNMQLLTNEFEQAAKGAGGFNKVINLTIESLTNWVRLYNDVFNPNTEKKLEQTIEKWQKLSNVLERGGFQGEKIIEAKKKELAALEEEINRLNDLIIVQQKLQSIESGSGRKNLAEQASAQNKRLEGLALQEAYLRDAFTLEEQLSNEILRLNGLWQGALVSTDEYTKKIEEAVAAQRNNADSTFGQNQGFTPSIEPKSEFYDSQLEQERDFINASLEQDIAYREERFNRAREEADRLKKIEEFKNKSILGSTASLFGSLSSIVGSGSKKQFELSKNLAKAEVAISTYASAQKAYEWASKFGGPAAGAAAAAAAIAAGLARLSAINRTSFSSSSAAQQSSGAGAFVPAPGPEPVAPNQTNAAQGQNIIIITDGNISEAQMDEIMERATQRINEGSQVIIRRDSVQAQELAQSVG